MKKTIRVTVNGRLYEEDVEPRILLSHFLRETIGLTGTHVGCVVGECGACSVLLDDKLIKSCLHFAVQADGCSVITIEGLAKDGQLSVIQEAFVRHYALQLTDGCMKKTSSRAFCCRIFCARQSA